MNDKLSSGFKNSLDQSITFNYNAMTTEHYCHQQDNKNVDEIDLIDDILNEHDNDVNNNRV